jgi:hypothetical protein
MRVVVSETPTIIRVTYEAVRVVVGPSTTDGGSSTLSDTTAIDPLTAVTNPLFLLGANAAGTFVRRVTPGSGTGGGLSLLLAADRAAVLSLLGSGTPSASNFLRGDGSWQAVSASPGGSNTQVQFNNAGAFGGDAGLTYNTTTDVLTCNSTVRSTTTELVLEQTGDAFGTSRMRLRNRTGFAGAIFENAAINLVDFQFQPSAGITRGFRFENRGGTDVNLGTPEFQIGGATMGDAPLVVSDSAVGVCRRNNSLSPSLFWLNASTTTFGRLQGSVVSAWNSVDGAAGTDATRSADLVLSAYTLATAQEGLRIRAAAAGVRLGFYGSTPVERQAVPAALGGGAALADVITFCNALRTAVIASTLFKA